MKFVAFVVVTLLGLILILLHVHLVEKDFLEIFGSADGLYYQHTYCFLELHNYVGLSKLSGLQARPPLVPLVLNASYFFLKRTLLAVYTSYALPRIFIFPVLFLLSLQYFSPITAYLISTLPLFFPYFETYSLATLKADVFVVAFSLLAVLFLQRFNQSSKTKYIFLTSLFASFTLLSKETGSSMSLVVWLLLAVSIFRKLRENNKYLHSKFKTFLSFIIPPCFLIIPFIIWSLMNTQRFFPSLFSTAIDLQSFPVNIRTYLLSPLYYVGVNFSLNRSFSIWSVIICAIFLLGIYKVVKKKYWEILLPPLALLISISLIHTKVVQGDAFNREIIHRIAPVMPFAAIILGLGIQRISQLLNNLKLYKFISIQKNWLILIVSVSFIYRYFSAPYALNYTDNEFYIDVTGVISNKQELPISTFRINQLKCVIQQVPLGKYLLTKYRSQKVSAFPQGYKELVIALWLYPLVIHVLFKNYIVSFRTKRQRSEKSPVS